MIKNIIPILLCFFFLSKGVAQDLTARWNKLGNKVEVALNAADGSFDLYVDLDAFIQRIIVPNPANPDIKKLNKTMVSSLKGGEFTFSKMLTKHGLDFKYKYLGQRSDSALVFRQWISEGGGFNYFTMKIDYIRERWKVIDIHVLMSGNYMSKTLKNSMYMPMVIRILSDKKKDKHRYSNFEIYIEAAQLLSAKEYDLAYTKVSGIPLEERTREQQIFKINASSMANSDEKYYKSIAEFEQRFPDDVSLSLILLDKLILDKNYKKAFECLEKMRPYTLNDPYIDYYNALVWTLNKKYKKAAKAIESAIKRESEEEYYWIWLDIFTRKKNHRRAVDVIEQIQQRFGYSKDEMALAVEESYYLFVLSKPYQNWLNNN